MCRRRFSTSIMYLILSFLSPRTTPRRQRSCRERCTTFASSSLMPQDTAMSATLSTKPQSSSPQRQLSRQTARRLRTRQKSRSHRIGRQIPGRLASIGPFLTSSSRWRGLGTSILPVQTTRCCSSQISSEMKTTAPIPVSMPSLCTSSR